MVLQENADGEILVAGENAISGCPYAVVALGENLVGTAINSQVRHPTFLQPNTLPRVLKTKTFCKQVAVWSVSPEGELTLSATWSGAFIAYMLARGPSPRTLIVGDALRSVTLLEYVPPASAPMQGQLKELGKDYRARYMVAVEALSSSRGSTAEGEEGKGGGGGMQRIIGAEADLNMFTLERDAQAGARDLADAGVLSAQGRWHVGEVVSRFRRGIFGSRFFLPLARA